MQFIKGNCTSLTSLDITNFNTGNVKDMTKMFEYCKLTSLDVSHFNTENVEYILDMFAEMENVISLDISDFK